MKGEVVAMQCFRYILGEDKHVKLKVRSPNDEPFTILEATYVLSIYGETEISGECEIDGHYLDIKLSPKTKSELYMLEVTYKVADSIRKARARIEVV